MICENYFKKKLDGQPMSICYCTKPENIENYDLAINDKDNIWICHHRLEEFYTRKELIKIGKYYNVPAEELIFVKNELEHRKLPHKGISKRNHNNKCSIRGKKFREKYNYLGKLIPKNMGPKLWTLYLNPENYM